MVANADDPLVVWAALAASSVTWVGAGQPWTVDAAGCPSCGGRIRFGADGAASGLGLQQLRAWRRPALDVWIEDDHRRTSGRAPAVPATAPAGPVQRANALMAMVAAGRFGVPGEAGPGRHGGNQTRWPGVTASVVSGSTRARLLLAKNPAGWLEVFDLSRPAADARRHRDQRPHRRRQGPVLALGRPVRAARGRLVVASGERSRDLAVRLHYAEVEHRHQPDPVLAIRRAGAPEVDVVANYTSFQAIATRLDRALRLDHAA